MRSIVKCKRARSVNRLKSRYVWFFTAILFLFFQSGFSQGVIFDTIPVYDTLPSKADRFNNKVANELPKAITDSITRQNKQDSAYAAAAKKDKTNKFVWNDRKYKLDTLSGVKVKRHSPLYATLFSLVLPGLGQAYNRKYWKIPIIYAGLGGLGYGLYYTTSNFYGYRNAYRLQVDENPATYGEYKGESNPATLKSYRDYFKRNVDLCAIFTGVWYALNLVDAAVDAHLFEWNMKDDIHLSWQPMMLNNYSNTAAVPGLKLNLNF